MRRLKISFFINVIVYAANFKTGIKYREINADIMQNKKCKFIYFFMELKKVGYCYASINQLRLILDNYFNEYQNNHFYIFNVETNKGINYQLIINRKKINFDFNKKVYFSIFGYSAGALAKFQQHTNITALSIREYNDIKGGAPYQVFKK